MDPDATGQRRSVPSHIEPSTVIDVPSFISYLVTADTTEEWLETVLADRDSPVLSDQEDP